MSGKFILQTFLITPILWLAVLPAAGQQAWLNEINTAAADAKGGAACRFVELRGDPDAPLNNLSFLLIEGDAGGNPGEVLLKVDLSEAKFGSNGLLIITGDDGGGCAASVIPTETARLEAANFDNLSGQSQSFILIFSFQPIAIGTDLDADDDGKAESLPESSLIVDGFGWTDGYEGDSIYTTVKLEKPANTPETVAPQAATRFPDDLTALSAGAWYYGNLGASKQSLTKLIPYDAEVVSGNFPPSGGLTPGAPNAPSRQPVRPAVLDFNGDGKTDYAVIRAIAASNPSQTAVGNNQSSILQTEAKIAPAVNWLIKLNGFDSTNVQQWGLKSDVFVPADYDGDGRTDIAVWRAGAAPNSSAFYILESASNTLRVAPLGEAGDNPLVVADYDGDGQSDPAVYRSGQGKFKSAWLYLPSSAANDQNSVRREEWGDETDAPAPGDYDGDGRADFCVRRRAEGGAGVFHLRFSATNKIEIIKHGLITDEIVRGDYDADGRADFCVRRRGKKENLFLLRKNDGKIQQIVLGESEDHSVPGDYDGDGRTDLAVWRFSSGVFWMKLSSAVTSWELVQFKWGQTGDYPAASWRLK